MAKFERITRNPAVMAGKPCIRGMRVTVGMILGQLGAGHTIDELLDDFPYLERADVMQALSYGAWLASGDDMFPEDDELDDEGSTTIPHFSP